MTAPPLPSTADHRRDHRTPARPGMLLGTLLLGQFMAILDASIVNVAAPTIGADLGAGGAGLQLVVSGYLISYAVLLITGARLGDRIGHGAAFRGWRCSPSRPWPAGSRPAPAPW